MSTRKYPSGCQKRKRRREMEMLIASQRGALDKFIFTKTEIENPNETQNETPIVEHDGDFSNAQNENPGEDEDKDPVDKKLIKHSIPQSIGSENENPREDEDEDEDGGFSNAHNENPREDEDPGDNKLIYHSIPKIIGGEKGYWRELLKRLVAIVQFMAKNYSTLSELGEDGDPDYSSRRFASLIKTIAEFDPVMQGHINRVENGEIPEHHLGHKLENKLVHMLACEIRTRIAAKVKEAKYFSVVLDSTSDASYEKQVSLTLRCVDVSTTPVKIEEFFLDFLKLDDTSDRSIYDELIRLIGSFGLDMDDMRGQGYDSVLTMKGEKEGLQRRLLDTYPRAFYVPCGCHSLSLVLSHIATYSTRSSLFGAMQCIYCLFSGSAQRWKVLTDQVPGLSTVHPLPETRWESCIECVKAFKTRPVEIRDALLDLAETESDPLVHSKAKSLVAYAMENFEFLLAMNIWYEILLAASSACKILESEDLCIDSAVGELQGVVLFLEKFRVTGFASTLDSAKEIALEMEVEPCWEESFRIEFFLYLVDQAISSLRIRLEQLKSFQKTFGFLLNVKSLKTLDDKILEKHCVNLANSLTHKSKIDIDGSDLYTELKVLRKNLPSKIENPIDVLNYVKVICCFPYTCICYRILFAAPVIVASSDRKFSKIESITTYLQSELSKECSSEWAILSIERDMLENIEPEDLVSSFASISAS